MLHSKVLKLPPAERIGLVDRLLDSLDQTDAGVDEAWAREVEGRLAAYRRGEIKAVGLAEVFAKYHSR